MSLSTAEIECVVDDLAAKLVGGRIERVDQPASDRIIIHVRRGQSRYWLQIVANPRFGRLGLLTRRPPQGKPVGGFCNVLRQGLAKGSVESLTHVQGDRVVILGLEGHDALLRPAPMRLIAELVGVGSNMVLVDGSDRVLGALRTEDSPRRRVFPGAQYQPLPAPPRPPSGKALVNRFADALAHADAQDELALSRAIESAYVEIETQAGVDERRAHLAALVRNRRKALGSRADKLAAQLAQADDAESLRRRGELLKCVMHELKKGQDSVVVRDFFDPAAPEVTISLDPRLSPEQNVEKRFRRYKKLKSGRQHVEQRLDQTCKELARVEAFAAELDGAGDTAALAALEKRAVEEALAPTAPGPRSARAAPSTARVFTSHDGIEILVARTQKQNHALTFSTARGNDYWMHLLGWEGPHVVLRKPRDKDMPLDTLLDAAHLAAYFSKLRGADYWEVMYTQRKHVSPIKGAPGKVSYAKVSRLAVRLDQDRLARLLGRDSQADAPK